VTAIFKFIVHCNIAIFFFVTANWFCLTANRFWLATNWLWLTAHWFWLTANRFWLTAFWFWLADRFWHWAFFRGRRSLYIPFFSFPNNFFFLSEFFFILFFFIFALFNAFIQISIIFFSGLECNIFIFFYFYI
jgi:hypothetical protein